jgi:hypothetical protein
MPLGLLVAHQLDPQLRPRLTQAAEQAGITLRTWENGGNLRTGEPAPAFIIAPLAAGARRLAPDLVHLADDLYPAARVLLVSQDPLVRPHLDLADGRLVLIDGRASAEDLAERFRAAGRWRAATPETPGLVREVRAGSARALVVRVGEAPGSLVCAPFAGGVIALLGEDRAGESVPPGLEAAVATWIGQPEQRQARAVVHALLAPWTAAAALLADGRQWLLGGEGTGPTLIAALRLPGWWTPGAVDRPRQVGAEPGDLVLLSGALPDDPAYARDRLALVARDGGRALADHLAQRAQALGLPLLAAVLDGSAA